jgi:polyvinyl alcohol dehydrogenase (cytochrome)
LLGASLTGAGALLLPRWSRAIPTRPSEWPAHGCGPDQTRHNRFEAVLGAKNVPRLKLRWQLEMGSGVTATPVVVDGRVIAGSWDGNVYAVDREGGRISWKFDAGVRAYPPDRKLGVFAAVAVDRGRVYVACDRLLALDLVSGALLWETTIGDPGKTLEYFWAPPLARGDRVWAGVSAGSETQTRGRIVCADGATGKLVWDFPTVAADVAGGALIAPPSLDTLTGTLFAATGNPFHLRPGPMRHACSLIALDAATGKLRWADQVHPHDTHNLDLNCPPMLVRAAGADLAIVGGKDGIRAWDRKTRKRLWRTQLTPALLPGAQEALPTNGPEAGPTAAARGLVFFASNNHADQTCVLAGIHAESGDLAWVHTLPAFQFGPMSVANGVLYMGLTDGKLRAWRAATGELLWESDVGQPIAGGPSIAGGMLFVGTGAGQFLPGNRLLAFAPEGRA